MSFKRVVTPGIFAVGEDLTRDLIGIGFRLTGTKRKNPNIENTLIAASIEGMQGDLRVLSLLVDWIEIHSLRINVDRLYRALTGISEDRILAFWTAIATWKSADRRFKRMEGLYKGKRIDLIKTGTDFQIERQGEDSRFERSPLRVANKAGLRTRPSDILTPSELARIHKAYFYRLLIGPTYRADMWAELETNPESSPAAIAHSTYGSFATAWQVKQEWSVLKDAR